MIYKLRRKFILISTASLCIVFLFIFSLIAVYAAVSVDRTMDTLTDAVSEGMGRFPDFDGDGAKDDMDENTPPPLKKDKQPDFIGGETRFSTRSFTVFYDGNGNVVRVNTEAIHTVDENAAVLYADAVMDKGAARGWKDNFRYKIYTAEDGMAVTFVDGTMNRSQSRRFVLGALGILSCSFAVVLLLIVIFSKKAVRPAAESYEKQRRFVTDANHGLKTPLTLILTDLDIAENELGKSEWLDDIRTESLRMTELVGRLITLTRMDEDRPRVVTTPFSLSETALDTVSEFSPLAEAGGKHLCADIAPDVTVNGDEGALRRVLAILLDNAVKYCDAGGTIRVTLMRGRRAVLTVENDFCGVGDTPLDRLFDRFYRADRARTAGSGFGIGLSIAKATVEQHRGTIEAYSKDRNVIGFRVTLRAE